MRKLMMTICAIVLTSLWVMAQEVTNETSFPARSIHVAISPSTSALIGVHGGLLGNSGGIVGGGDLISSGGVYLAARYNDRSIMTNDRLSVDLGVSLQLLEFAYVFAGGGYGKYVYPYKEPTLLPDKEIDGFEIDGGVLFRMGKITFHAGLTTLKFEHLDFYGGIGYTF